MYEVRIKSAVDVPNTDNESCRQWNTVAKAKTWASAERHYRMWVESHGYDHWVETLLTH